MNERDKTRLISFYESQKEVQSRRERLLRMSFDFIGVRHTYGLAENPNCKVTTIEDIIEGAKKIEQYVTQKVAPES